MFGYSVAFHERFQQCPKPTGGGVGDSLFVDVVLSDVIAQPNPTGYIAPDHHPIHKLHRTKYPENSSRTVLLSMVHGGKNSSQIPLELFVTLARYYEQLRRWMDK